MPTHLIFYLTSAPNWYHYWEINISSFLLLLFNKKKKKKKRLLPYMDQISCCLQGLMLAFLFLLSFLFLFFFWSLASLCIDKVVADAAGQNWNVASHHIWCHTISQSTSLINVFIKTHFIYRIALEIHGVIRLALIPFVTIREKKNVSPFTLYPNRITLVNMVLFTIRVHRNHLYNLVWTNNYLI